VIPVKRADFILAIEAGIKAAGYDGTLAEALRAEGLVARLTAVGSYNSDYARCPASAVALHPSHIGNVIWGGSAVNAKATFVEAFDDALGYTGLPADCGARRIV
jgi:hypothetical protein